MRVTHYCFVKDLYKLLVISLARVFCLELDPRFTPHGRKEALIQKYVIYNGRETLGISGREMPASSSMIDYFCNCTDFRDYNRSTRCERLDRYSPERLVRF